MYLWGVVGHAGAVCLYGHDYKFARPYYDVVEDELDGWVRECDEPPGNWGGRAPAGEEKGDKKAVMNPTVPNTKHYNSTHKGMIQVNGNSVK